MSFLHKISTGKQGRAQKVVVYAPEGFGKSLLASQFPNPLFLDIEGSTAQLDVARLGRDELPDLKSFRSALAEIIKAKPCQTLVVDTIDWLEQLVEAHVIAEAGNPKIQGIEDFGYGKGYVYVKEAVALLLAQLDQVIGAGMHVVLLAHSKVARFEPPDSASPFDRYELKLSKHVSPLIKEWADALLFGNWRLQVREQDNGKAKGVGGKERLMHCVRTAAWDAKNRHGLQDTEKWEIATIERAFKSVGAPWGESAAKPAAEAPKPASTKPAPAANAEPKAEAKTDPAPEAKTEPKAEPAPESKPEPAAEASPAQPSPELARICAPHAEAINAYLLKARRIKAGQTWANVDAVFAARVIANPAGFLKVAGVKLPQAEEAAAA